MAQEQRLFQEIGRRLADALTLSIAHRNLSESEERFRLVFENSPVSIWKEDFSAVKLVLDDLRSSHVEDIDRHLLWHPETVQLRAEKVRVVDINPATLELHEASSKEELLHSLSKTFASESYSAFRHELVALWRGETELVLDGVVKTLTGKLRQVTVYFSVCPGYEKSLGKVLVSSDRYHRTQGD